MFTVRILFKVHVKVVVKDHANGVYSDLRMDNIFLRSHDVDGHCINPHHIPFVRFIQKAD